MLLGIFFRLFLLASGRYAEMMRAKFLVIGVLASSVPAFAAPTPSATCPLPNGKIKIDYARVSEKQKAATPRGGDVLSFPNLGFYAPGFQGNHWKRTGALVPTADCKVLRFFTEIPNEKGGPSRAPSDEECADFAKTGIPSLEAAGFFCVDFKVYESRKDAKGKDTPFGFFEKQKGKTVFVTRESSRGRAGLWYVWTFYEDGSADFVAEVKK
jgi:hypothetical protein